MNYSMMHLHPPARSAVRLPANNYPLWDALPPELVNSKLSSLQLEGIISACNMHQRILASGERAGFFIGGWTGGRPMWPILSPGYFFSIPILACILTGDGAGVGKGRQIAGTIIDNWARGRRCASRLSLWLRPCIR